MAPLAPVLLNGWTAAGKRPEFKVVTGVSTGALTAPFAFLGPKYDHALTEVYTTTVSKDDIFKKRGMIKGVLSAIPWPIRAIGDD